MMSKKHGIDLKPGTHIIGKWHQNQYIIQRKLGSGTVGTVYLCESNGQKFALKISKQNSSITVEVNVLKEFAKVQGINLGPSLVDIDDFETNHGTYSFYVMEYLRGESISQFIRRNGSEWIGVFMLQLLADLDKLHHHGWVFGDLKAENLLVVSHPTRIRWVDVGGTTQIGRAIKEYTEFYDRGYWGLGTRKAEPSYDLFAFVMVFLSIYYPNYFSKTVKSKQTIYQKIDKVQPLKPYSYCLKKAINGEYHSSVEMKQDLVSILYSWRKGRTLDQGKNRLPLFIESGGILLLSVIYYLSSKLLF